jgi:hypothetical protein
LTWHFPSVDKQVWQEESAKQATGRGPVWIDDAMSAKQNCARVVPDKADAGCRRIHVDTAPNLGGPYNHRKAHRDELSNILLLNILSERSLLGMLQ